MQAPRLCVLLVLAGTTVPLTLEAQSWPRFRGPNGSGVSADAPIPTGWTAADFNWKVKLPGVGHSSPVVWGRRLFLTSGDPATGKRYLLCLDTDSGRQLWVRERAGHKHGKHALNSLATASPAVDAEHVYFCWATPKDYAVLALDHDGKEVWREDLGPHRSGHGSGASPIVHDDLLIVPNEQDGDSCIVALDRRTGKVRWKASRAREAGWSTPCVRRTPEGAAELIVTNYRRGIAALDLATGKELWSLDVFDKRHLEAAIGSPVVAGELVLGTCGWLGVRQEVVAVRPGPGGKATRVWTVQRSAPLCTTPVVKGELAILWSDEGIVSCVELRTGKVHWRERTEGSFYASPVCVGERVYNVNRDGDVFVLAFSREYKQLARNSVGEGTHATPAVAGGRMYLRTYTHLISIGGKR
jgi:outer membrane protein assembly factor BamB